MATTTFHKREKEAKRREKAREKELRRQDKPVRAASRGGPGDEDPDLAGMVAGPQPLPDED